MLKFTNDKLNYVLSKATEFHDGQFRKDNVTPYITHPIAICNMMIEDGICNLLILSVALLHDVVEDTSITDKQLYDICISAFPYTYQILYDTILDMTNIDKLYKSLLDAKINRATKKKLMNEHFARFANQYAIYTKIYDRYHNLLDLDTMKADNDFKKKYVEESSALVTALETGLNRYLYLDNDLDIIVRSRLAKLKELLKEKDLCFSK